jgi:glycosyltransferase involved in cell wall biosynthesis
MKQRIVDKGIANEKIEVLPPWSNDDKIRNDEQGREEFRTKHDLTDKFVVMYSGNHSPCHPLDSLLKAARLLSHRNDLAFCFVGGGTEQAKVRAFAERHGLANVKCLPYQPLEHLSSSLSAADLHVVVMGDGFRGIVHPSKIYNILLIGKPVIYIGPEPSHITDIAIGNGVSIVQASHGDVERVVQNILTFRRQWFGVHKPSDPPIKFSRSVLLPQIIRVIEGEVEVSSATVDVVKDAIIAPLT